jgi:hypothetical protein
MRFDMLGQGAMYSRIILSSIIVAAGAFITTTLAGAVGEEEQTGAPLGLEWGLSTAQVRALGVDLKDVPLKDYGSSYAAARLPKIIADTETVLLSFGFDDKLWRIVMVSKAFTNDPYGSAVRSRYDELSNELAEKYGRGEQHHQPGEGVYAEADKFVAALHMGNTWYYTNYTTNLLWVQLSIRAKDFSTAFYQIIFEHKALRSDFEKAKKIREKESL